MNDLKIIKVDISAHLLTVHLNDERVISLPLKRFPRINNVNSDLVENFIISPSGYGIHWPDLDEDISIKAFL